MDTTDAINQEPAAGGAVESLLLSDSENQDTEPGFDDLGLDERVLRAVHDLGYEMPTPIQARAIPVLLEGGDMLGQAQTGTGKTAAFALPLLSRLNGDLPKVQALILEPTRELALQVAEAIQSLARHIEGFRVVPIYGGAAYENQIRALRHGAQVVVGTPGRLIDLQQSGKLRLDSVSAVVLDEADEMLNMGFLEDVDLILRSVPKRRQSALFSATMPEAIEKIAREHLSNPTEIRIESPTATATTVHQRYWVATGFHKIEAMTRLLEMESYDAVLVFVRTKTDAEDVAGKLMARGFVCAALHGDIPQRQREKIIERVRGGTLDIIVATDVAARGLDVERFTHVINYDIPYDAESYVHRIGRTGRAGRTGEAIVFVSPRERRVLRTIERVTGSRIEPMVMPSAADINKARLERFKQEILSTIEAGGLEVYEQVITDILGDDTIEPETVAAALAKMTQRGRELLLDESQPEPQQKAGFSEKDGRDSRDGASGRDRGRKPLPSARAGKLRDYPDLDMVRFRLAVGRRDGARPSQIVGAIANEGQIESRYIGAIEIYDSFSTVDLPSGMPEDTRRILEAARVCGRPLQLREYQERDGGSRDRGGRKPGFGERDRKKARPRPEIGASFRHGGRRGG